MSYARFGEGDVYVFGTVRGWEELFECCWCRFVPTEWVDEPEHFLGGYIRSISGERTSYTTASRADMIAHLTRHRDAGHKVPDRAFEGLAAETEWGQQ